MEVMEDMSVGFHDGAHDLFLRCLGRGHLGDEAAFVHHVEAVGDAQQLGHLRRDHDHALAFGGQLRDEGVDLVLGTHVDAARGLVEDEDFGAGEEPFAQHHLLLVAPREVERLLVHAGGADAQLLAEPLGHRVLAAAVDHAGRGDALQVGQRDVEPDVLVQHQAVALAVFGHVGQAVAHGLLHGADVDGLPVQQHLAADAPAPGAAEEAHGQLGTAGPHQAGDADYFSAPHLQVDALEEGRVGPLRVVGLPAAHLEGHRADVGCARRIAVRHLAADHGLDHAVLADGRGAAVHGFHRAAVAQHGDGVGHARNLVELVRDQDAGDALALELQQQVQQGLAVVLVQAGGGLVQDQQAHLPRQRLGDFNQLLLAHAQLAHQGLGRFLQAHLAQQRLRPVVRLHPVDDAVARGLVAQEDVLGDGEQGHQGQFLVDDDDAQVFAVADACEPALFAVEDDFAAVAAVRIDAGQHFHQRGFACAVLAHDGVDLSGLHAQVHPVQGHHPGEGLADVPHL